MPELWRTVVECDRYEVSSLGRVRNKKRGNVLKPFMRNGYPSIQLGLPERKQNIHVLVCAAWHGPRPEGMFACHRNDDRTDNRPENLYWGTHQQNMDDGKSNQRFMRGEAHVNAKLTQVKVGEMRALRAETGLSYAKIALRYGVTKRAALLAIKGVTWTSD